MNRRQEKGTGEKRKKFRNEVLGEFEGKNILFTSSADSDAVEVHGKVRFDELESFQKVILKFSINIEKV